jgi:hypothetical protein
MEGLTEIDPAKHKRDFTERLKGIVTKERLEPVCRRDQDAWGYFQEGHSSQSFDVLLRSQSFGGNGAPGSKLGLLQRWSLSNKVRGM